MGLFDKEISEIREFLAGAETHPRRLEYRYSAPVQWPRGMGKSVVLSQDTAVELGNPRVESCSFVVWDDNPGRVRDGAITLIGPELSECDGMSIPFGKVIIAGVSGFTAENSYDRYREMDNVRYDLDLRGYMLRAASQYQREWSRVSHEALREGFSFRVLGGSLIDAMKKTGYVESVEVIFITSSPEDVRSIRPISEGAGKIIGAMTKMIDELDYDCGSCSYNDVCSDVADLRSMRQQLEKRGELRYGT
jgi:CO dehydrogenase/acetyl-CoA synthase beta subunit